MNRRWLPAFAVAALLPALLASDGGCKQDSSVLEGMPLTEVNVLQVTVDPGTASPVVLIEDLERSAVLPIVIGSGRRSPSRRPSTA